MTATAYVLSPNDVASTSSSGTASAGSARHARTDLLPGGAMSAARGLLRELIERRLWPVAVLLLIAAVAVPIYLGRSTAQDAAVAPPSAAQPDAPTSKAAVTIEAQAERRPPRRRAQPVQAAARAEGPLPSRTDDHHAGGGDDHRTTGGSTGSGSDGSVPPVRATGTGTGTGTGDRHERREPPPSTRSTPTT